MTLIWNVFGTWSLLECRLLTKLSKITCYNNISIPVWHVMMTVPILLDFLGNLPTLCFQQTVIAERRTRHLVKRLASTPKLLQVYSDILKEQEARRFIQRVDATKDHSGSHYLPHHHVEKDSSMTPIRIVFDCSCRQGSNHPCLNDCLTIGFQK